ncbi:hypothetical protein PSHT_15243, partial [Puccinia striiformis]
MISNTSCTFSFFLPSFIYTYKYNDTPNFVLKPIHMVYNHPDFGFIIVDKYKGREEFMEDVDREISEMKLSLNARARIVAESYLTQV